MLTENFALMSLCQVFLASDFLALFHNYFVFMNKSTSGPPSFPELVVSFTV